MPDGGFPAPRGRQVRDDPLEPRPRRRAEVGCAFSRRADRTVRDVLVSGLCVHPPAGLSSGGMRRPDAGILRARAREELLSRRRSGERALSRFSLRRRSATFCRTSAIARRRLKRGGTSPPISLDVETAEGTYRIEPRDDLTPEKLFDRRWALILLERVLARLRDSHAAAGKGELFDRLKGFLTGDSAGLPYADVARALGMTRGSGQGRRPSPAPQFSRHPDPGDCGNRLGTGRHRRRD